MQLTDKQYRLLQLGLDELTKVMGVELVTIGYGAGDAYVLSFKPKGETSGATEAGTATGVPGEQTLLVEEDSAPTTTAIPTESGTTGENTQSSASTQSAAATVNDIAVG